MMCIASAAMPTTSLQSSHHNCTIGKNDHCTYDDMFVPYNDQHDTDCDCIPDSCDSEANDSNYGSLDDCKSHKDEGGTLARIAVITTLLSVLALIYIFRNSWLGTCCESSEQYKERQRKNAADRKKIKELTSERDALLQSTKNLESGVDIQF
tara:strand:+ start:35 stop:490 length:456 start_codon:yes stop_codon:yes gene_type:complete